MKFRAFIDGAARGNPGPAGAGVWIEPRGEEAAEELFASLGRTTNNVAEYRALLLALGRARELRAEDVEIFSDSELLVRQVQGHYRVKADHLKPLVSEAIGLARGFRRFSISHVRREQNRNADRLANRGADASEVS
jgi:ribonuclease HI